MSDTPTPRTNAVVQKALNGNEDAMTEDLLIVARELERENQKLRKQLERLEGDGIHTCHNQCPRIACVLRRENQELRQQVAELQRDKARLDAIAHHFWEVAGNRFGQWVVLFPNPDGSELIAKENSIRKAIDAAMQSTQTQTEKAPIVPDRLTQAEATLAQHEKEIRRLNTL